MSFESSSCSSSLVMSRSFSAFMRTPSLRRGVGCFHARPLYIPALEGQLVRRQPHGFLGHLAGHALHLVNDLSRLDHVAPCLGRSLAFPHPGFRRLLGDRLPWKYSPPDLSAALDETSHRDAARLDLAGGHPAALERLEPEVAERQRR